jgi:hypothetical protein
MAPKVEPFMLWGIMCSADTTLEGKTEAGPGEGSEHEW